jgi:hypothetical protein
MHVGKVVFWVDSTAVYHWVKNEKDRGNKCTGLCELSTKSLVNTSSMDFFQLVFMHVGKVVFWVDSTSVYYWAKNKKDRSNKCTGLCELSMESPVNASSVDFFPEFESNSVLINNFRGQHPKITSS